MSGRRFVAIALGLALALPAAAIIRRHDKPDADYVVPASRLAAVGKISPDGEGVLIGPRWVLTAAHVATSAPPEAISVTFGGIEYGAADALAFPGWDGRRHDLALIELERPVRGVEPLKLADDALEPGMRVTLAGRGDHGDAERGIVGNDGKFRLATNIVDAIEADRFSIVFDGPDGKPTSNEGISGPGDSGTPALLSTPDELRVAGIGSMGQAPQGARYGAYGSRDVFVRTSHYRAWIADGMAGRAERWAPAQPPAGSAETADAYVAAFNEGAPAMRRWLREWMSVPALADAPVAERLERYEALRGRFGELELLQPGRARGPFDVVLQLRDGNGERLDLGFDLDADGKVDGVAIMRFDP
jgi:hypothetical protein